MVNHSMISLLQTKDLQVVNMLQGFSSDDTFWDCVFATTIKNLDTAEDVSTFGAAPRAWASLGRLPGMPTGDRQGRDGGSSIVVPGGTFHLPDGAHVFRTPSLKCKH